jgi:hypothetical protein
MSERRRLGAGRRVAVLGAVTMLAAGCASANKTASTTPSSSKPAGSSKSSSASSTAGMNMPMSSTVNPTKAANLNDKGVSIDGIHVIPTQLLAQTEWQGMKIQAYATTAVPFMVYDGTGWNEVKPTKKTSFHLMVTLTDADTGVAIPYSTVWVTIAKHGKVVYDERQYPMISRYMGPHYGNDVQVPGAGTYQLTLLVSPPVAARHIEYKSVWLAPHRATVSFHWNGG